MSDYDYDLFIIGTGPGGQRAAVQAAKLGLTVGICERKAVVGGICFNTGTIPSKTLRAAVMHLSGYNERSIYGASYSVKGDITMEDLLDRADHVVKTGIDVVRHQLVRNGIDVIEAEASFVDAHVIKLTSIDGTSTRQVSSDKIIIATGTSTTRDPHIPFDGQKVLTSDEILSIKKLPKTLAVVGAGVIGAEYATMFATLGVRVTLIDKRPKLLSFIDDEIVDALIHHMRENRMTIWLGEEVKGITHNDEADNVCLELESGKKIGADMILYSVGRTGATDELALENAGLTADERGRIVVNEDYQSEVPQIYAVGDVIGFPALASTSSEQGRLATCHAFNVESKSVPELFPYGIYTIPEISTCGRNEQELTEDGVSYEIGKASYREIARGQIVGDRSGLLKLLFERETRKLLGIHIIGEGASELIHIGQAVLSFNGTIDYFIDTVFNYPTFAECYKTAAFDGINRLA